MCFVFDVLCSCWTRRTHSMRAICSFCQLNAKCTPPDVSLLLQSQFVIVSASAIFIQGVRGEMFNLMFECDCCVGCVRRFWCIFAELISCTMRQWLQINSVLQLKPEIRFSLLSIVDFDSLCGGFPVHTELQINTFFSEFLKIEKSWGKMIYWGQRVHKKCRFGFTQRKPLEVKVIT